MPSTARRGKKTASRKSQSASALIIKNAASPELIDRFRDFVLKDRDVQENLRHVTSARGITKLASKYGFKLSEKSVREAMQSSDDGLLSVGDLGGLMVAAPCWCKKSVVNSKSCK